MAGEKWVFNNYYADVLINDDGNDYLFKRWLYTELSSDEYTALAANAIFSGKVTDGVFSVVEEEPDPPAPAAQLVCVYPITITENGEVTAPEGVAYSPITVDVTEE